MRSLLAQLAKTDVDLVRAFNSRSPLIEVVVALYARDASQQRALIQRYSDRPSALFADCTSGVVQPSPNPPQSEVSKLFPQGGRTFLHVRASGSIKRVAIERGHDGLWIVVSRRATTIDAKEKLKGGIVIRFPWPDDDGPTVERVFSGTSNIVGFGHELCASYELRRDLSHCVLVCDFFGGLHGDTVVVRGRKGKTSFAFKHPVDTDRQTLGFVEPFDFEHIATHLYAPMATKPIVVVRLDVSTRSIGSVNRQRALLPQVRNTTPNQPQGQRDGRGQPKEQTLIEHLLYCRLLPLVGLDRGDGQVDVCGLSYDPESGAASVVVYANQRFKSRCGALPVLTLSETGATWIPNQRAVTLLRGLVFDSTPDDKAAEARWKALCKVFRYLGVTATDQIPDAFSEWGQQFTLSEMAEFRGSLP